MLNQPRFEKKFIVAAEDLRCLLSSLQVSLPIDSHVNADGFYHVSSLYYDTPDFELYWQHKNASYYRFKFRRRTYNHSSKGHFEVKEKRDLSFKKRTIDESEEKHIILERSSYFSGPIEKKLFTHYMRFAFDMPQLRVTLDCDIQVETFSRGIVRSLPFGVLEIKTIQESHPLIQHLIAPYNLRPVSFSKYLTAVEELSLV